MIWNICENKTLEDELQNVNDNSDDGIDSEDHKRFRRCADPEPRGYRGYFWSGKSSDNLEDWIISLFVIGVFIGFGLTVVGIIYYCLIP